MKKAGLEKIFIGVLSVSIITNTTGFLQPVKSLNFTNNLDIREINEDSVMFEQEYAKIGEPLTVTSNLTGELSYKWKVGDKLVSNAVSYSPTVNDLEKFISVEISNGIKTLSTRTYFSRLPVVYINTENGSDVTSKDYYINGEMKIQGNERYNLETTKLYDGKIEIKGRGNSTWGLPKKPYKIKLDSKTNLFSMGKNKHWVLLANYYDSSSLRNTLSYDLSGALDMPQTETVHTGVIFNGKYVGTYQFCEQIRVDEKRVDVLNWDDEAKDLSKIIATKESLNADDLESYLAENLSWTTSGKFNYQGKTYLISNYDYTIPSINGGYLLELDSNYDEVSKFKTNSNQPLMFKAPEFAVSNQDMMNYVKNYIQAYENAVMSKDYHSMYEGNTVHYSELFDMDSLVDYWLVTELFFNEDGMKKSTYMYKDVDDKFHMGPIWDMDWSSGASQSAAVPTNQWQTLYFPAYGNSNEPQLRQWYRYLIKDPYFVSCVKQRYEEVRNNQIADMMASIEDYRVYLKEAGASNSIIWYGNTNTGEYEISKLKSWLTDRLAFMDEQFSSLSKLYASLGVKVGNEQLILKDHNGVVLPAENDFNGISNARNLIKVEMNVTDQNTKKIALYSNGELVGEELVIEGKVIFEYTLPTSGNYVLQAYKLDQNDNVINSKEITANLLVEPSITMELESIEIESLPNKLSYYQGEKLDVEGLAVNAIFNTGNKISLNPDEYTVSSLTNEPGVQTIVISYNGKTVSFDVEVKELVLDTLTIKKLPNKIEYYVGEKLDLSGLIVEGTYNNGNTEEITNYTVSELTDKVGEQTITVSYQGKEITFTVLVLENTISTNKTALSIAVEMAGNVTEEQLDKVVPAVVTEFNAALEEARAILANDSATQEEVDASFARLSVAMHMLEFLKGDKAELQDLVDSTADLVEGNYTEESWSALQEALTNANTVLNDENAMQEEVDEAHDNLQAAIDGLEEVEVVDKSLLEAMVNKVLGLEEDKYIASSWQAMLPELEAAQEVLGNEKATQAEVDEACDALTRGYLNLRLKPNKDLLADLINKANGLNSASYTANTWAVVADEVIKAQAVLEDPEASEAEVKTAEKALTKALSGLEVNSSNPVVDGSTNKPVETVKPGDTTANAVKTGDEVPAYGLVASVALMISLIAAKKKKCS
ncbi:CotH kinase family protein [Thomasclavelia cocleata]|uniref:CotH kinase family protein n=12 Tax=Thomasclavelia cocleata TaxID=69824 RepID=UPI00243065C6|nr:CotH kinase family protein [Thomasclavelia cocleata]